MRSFGLKLLLIVLVAFGLWLGNGVQLPAAEARPLDIISFNQNVCAFAAIGTAIENGASVAAAESEAAADCYPTGPGVGGLYDPAHLADLATLLGGDVDNPDTYGGLVDGSAGQLGEDSDFGQVLWVVTVVTNDAALHLDADEGVWASSGASQADCDAPANLPDLSDEDCDNDGVASDGVVVDMLSGAGVADRGDAAVTASQAGIDVMLEYTVVGMPVDVSLGVTRARMDVSQGAACDLSLYFTQVSLVDVSGLTATVVDSDNTELTGIWVDWNSSSSDVVGLARIQHGPDAGDAVTSTVSRASNGAVAAVNLGCSGTLGASTMTAATSANPAISDNLQIEVVASMCTGIIIIKNANASSVPELGQVTYTISVEFSGDPDCTDIEVQDPIPDDTDCLDAWVAPESDVPSEDVNISGCDASGTVTWSMPASANAGDVAVLKMVLGLTPGLLEGDRLTNEACVLAAGYGVVDCDTQRVDVGPGEPLVRGDVNCDGKISMLDAMLVAQKALHLISDFPGCEP